MWYRRTVIAKTIRVETTAHARIVMRIRKYAINAKMRMRIDVITRCLPTNMRAIYRGKMDGYWAAPLSAPSRCVR